MLFWGYTEATGQAMSGRVRTPDFPADLILEFPANYYYSVPNHSRELCSYKSVDAGTPYGPLPLAAMTGAQADSPLPMPRPGEVWLPEQMQQHWQIAVGDDFPIRFSLDYKRAAVIAKVAGFYQAFAYDPVIVVSDNWLSAQDINLTAPLRAMIQKTRADQFDRWLRNINSNVKVINAGSVLQQAREIVSSTLSSGEQAVFILFMFLTLGVGTFSLLTYMDSRRELSILKSMGLRPAEVGRLFVLEAAFTASIGYLLSLFITSFAVSSFNVPVVITTQVALRALIYLILAYALASGLPYVLAKRGTVNELMLNRPVPLLSSEVTTLARRYPALEERLQAGYQCVKLPTVDGEFRGICFRATGQPVKKGETVAWEGIAWGLAEKHYISPCDGEVVECNLKSGILLIKPCKV